MTTRKDGQPRRPRGSKAAEARRLAAAVVGAEQAGQGADEPLAALRRLVGAGNVAYHVLAAREAGPLDPLWPRGGRPNCTRCHEHPVYLAGLCSACWASEADARAFDRTHQCSGYVGDTGASAPRCEGYASHPGRHYLRPMPGVTY